MADIAQIGIKVDTSGVEKGARALDQLTTGATRAESAIKRMSGATGQTAQGMGNVNRTLGKTGDISKQTAFEMRQLSFQMNDVATGLLSGQSPFQIIAQQGGQVYQALQMGPKGVGGSIKEIGNQLKRVVTPARAVMGGLAVGAVTAAVAWNRFDDQVKAVQRSLNGLGRGAGNTTTSLFNAARMAAANSPQSFGSAYSGAATLSGFGVSAGLVGPSLIAARRMSGATGTGLGETQSLLGAVLQDPTKGLGKLSQMFGPFSLELEDSVKRLQATNNMQLAQAKVLDALNKRLAQTTDQTGYLGAAFEKLSGWMSSIGMAIGRVGRGPTPQERYAAASRDYSYAISRRGTLMGPTEDQIARLKENLDEALKAVQAEAKKSLKAQLERIAAEQQRIDKTNKGIIALGENEAKRITAVTAAQRLAADIERIRVEAIRDTTREATKAAEIERARTVAIAQASRAMFNFQKSLRDELYTGGALNDRELRRRQLEIRFRDIRNETNVLGRGGSAGATSSGGMNGTFMERLKALMAAVPGVSIGSGYRSTERQAELFAKAVAKYGSEAAARKWVAPPGKSMHNVGLAADLRFASPEARAQAHRRAGEFGLRFRMGHEPWHVEPAEGRRLAGGAAGARSMTVSGGLTAGGALARGDANILAKMFYDVEVAAKAQAAELRNSVATFGLSTEAVARSTEKLRLENMVREKGIPITDTVQQKINGLAEAHGRYAAAAERVAEVQRKAIEGLDLMRDSVSDLISGPLKDIAAGRKPGEAFRAAGARLGGRLIDAGAGGISEFLLGGRGKPGGGLFGSLLGQSMQSAMMNVKAGVVNVQGGIGIGGIGGKSGGIGGFFSSLFGGSSSSSFGGAFSLYANGGIMTPRGPLPLKKYSTGGVASSPQMAIFGEGRTPEAYVPLPDGKNIPVKMVQGRKNLAKSAGGRGASQNISMGGISVTVQGNADDRALQAMESRLAASQAKQMKALQRNFGSISTTYQEDYL